MNGREHRDGELTRLSASRLFLLCLDSSGSRGPRRASTEAQTVRKTNIFNWKQERSVQKVEIYFRN